MDRCKYKDIFGKPREGVHAIRIFDIAIVDLLLTFLAAWFISDKYFPGNLLVVFFALFLLGMIMHRLFCVDSKF